MEMNMNGRELINAIYAGEKVDRLPLPGIGPWGETLQRWRTEGLGETEDYYQALGLKWDDRMGVPLNLNMVPAFEVKILDKGERYVTLIDEYGVTKKMLRDDFDRSQGLKGNAGAMSGMSQWIDFPVKDPRSWKELYETRFRGDNLKDRLPADWFSGGRERHVEQARTRWVEYFVFPLVGFFGPIREMMGLEGLIFAMADDPSLVHTMVRDLGDYWLACFSRVLRDGVRLDQFCFFEDLCATKGPLLSPAMFREFFAPGYKRVIGGLREMGVAQFFTDSDGNLAPLIADLIACGITSIGPCEVNSGMEADQLRRAWPGLVLNGGIDKRAMTRGFTQIDRELERRYTTAWTMGRYLPGPDHGIPPDVSWTNIKHVAEGCLKWCRGRGN